MSILFQPIRLGQMVVRNRFVRSAASEAMATEQGEATEDLVRYYRSLARGQVGLIVSGFMYVHPLGRMARHQPGIHDDALIEGLRKLCDAVHDEGGRIAFQLGHSGRQTTPAVIGRTPLAPSSRGRDLATFVKPAAMSEEQIAVVIAAFGQAARRAAEAGADAVQIQATHGFLLNQFLSPYMNVRDDAWGGSDEKRFLIVRETVLEVRQALPAGMPVLVKLSTHDFAPKEGVTPPLAVTYARWLAELGIDGFELSCGIGASWANMCRGEIPVEQFAATFPRWQRPFARVVLRRMVGKFDLEEGYNVPASQLIKPAVGNLPVMVVGGLRRLAHMEEIVQSGFADLVSMARPLIREPDLVRRFQEGKAERAACISCNRCFATVVGADKPLRCWQTTAGV
jgi:2,4-dienoyl-CoA reductase-like NADH-dependent reductase (Old Yellow Enzyme family)